MSAKWITAAFYVIEFKMMFNRHKRSSDIRSISWANFTSKIQVFTMIWAYSLQKSQRLTCSMGTTGHAVTEFLPCETNTCKLSTPLKKDPIVNLLGAGTSTMSTIRLSWSRLHTKTCRMQAPSNWAEPNRLWFSVSTHGLQLTFNKPVQQSQFITCKTNPHSKA